MQDLQLPLPTANGLSTLDVQSIHEQAVQNAEVNNPEQSYYSMILHNCKDVMQWSFSYNLYHVL